MSEAELICREERRRGAVREAALYGLDFVEVGENQLALEVFFLGKAPPKVEAANLRIMGGERIRDIRVTGLRVQRQRDPVLDDRLEVELDRYGDHGLYRLSLVALDGEGRPTDAPMEGFDPRYASVEFTFKASCPTDLDCKRVPVCPPPQRPAPEIDYLAKDYESLRRLILDRLALVMPEWQERHAPDLGVTLVELLAYAGDHLSYYQDAVATEAYLDTARQRISVRRHARLVDYRMHEGCNARAWLTIKTDTDTSLNPAAIAFCTALPTPAPAVLREADLRAVPAGSYEIFSPLWPATVRLLEAHNEIQLYAWGDCACCLPKGATQATLLDAWADPAKKPAADDGAAANTGDAAPAARQAADQQDASPEPARALDLRVGDVLIFEEVIGPRTGLAADADPRHRQAVRLTRVTPAIDPLYHQKGFPDRGTPVLEIAWCAEDALEFPLCISARMPPPDCSCREGISVARGNVILVENSTPVDAPVGTVPTLEPVDTCPTDCEPGETVLTAGPFRPSLSKGPLTFSEPLPPCACASRMIAQDPRRALPRITLTGTSGDGEKCVPIWTAQADLLESGPEDAHFTVEIDDLGTARLRFGDGAEGRRPGAGEDFSAHYGIGNGPAGNVGAETITTVVWRNGVSGLGLMPRNPMPAAGGTAPEPVAEVKMFAPHAFHVLERAITAEDYAALATGDDRRLASRHGEAEEPCRFTPFRRLQGAKAGLRWTGSWYEAEVAIDPLGSEDPAPALIAELETYLGAYRRIGHDLRVEAARYVALDLALSVCVLPHALRGDAEAALLEVFGSRVRPDGSLGFFHPDRLSFGEGVAVSRIVAAAQAVAGVMEVGVARLKRYAFGEPAPRAEDPPERLPRGGILALRPFEVARLDNDPSFPERGRLTLHLRGGR